MYEIASEDPYWSGEYGKAYTLGMQNGSSNSKYYDERYYLAVVTLKHFAAYSLENSTVDSVNRHNFNAEISPYMFSDTYFPAWKKTVEEGGQIANSNNMIRRQSVEGGIYIQSPKFMGI